jgi:integrase
VPWIKLPRLTWPVPRVVPPEHLDAACRAADLMTVPQIPGIRPAQWWRSLLAVALNTGMRRRTLLSLEWAHVDFERRRAVLPAEIMKSRRPLIVPLNVTAFQHLLAIRDDAGLVFPWPLSPGKFDKYFHHLQDLAGIDRPDHFGLRHERKTFGTEVFEVSPAAAQWAMGHTTLSVTLKHYVAGDALMAKAVERLPQPPAFIEHAGGAT